MQTSVVPDPMWQLKPGALAETNRTHGGHFHGILLVPQAAMTHADLSGPISVFGARRLIRSAAHLVHCLDLSTLVSVLVLRLRG